MMIKSSLHAGTAGCCHWTQKESQMSINWSELKAGQIALQTFSDLNNQTILIRTDNTMSMAYINNKQGGAQ